jgi:hypothetical protein
MAKKKRSRTSDFSLGNSKKVGGLPTRDEINSAVAKATDQVEVEKESKKRIPFTTALSPENRALLETASHEGRGGVADILNLAIAHYFENVAPVGNREMKKIFLKIYESKAK